MAELVRDRVRARSERRLGFREPEGILRDGDPVVADPAEAVERATRLLGRRVERGDKEHVGHGRRPAQGLHRVKRILCPGWWSKGWEALRNLLLVGEGQEILALKSGGRRRDRGGGGGLRNIDHI